MTAKSRKTTSNANAIERKSRSIQSHLARMFERLAILPLKVGGKRDSFPQGRTRKPIRLAHPAISSPMARDVS